MCEEDLGLFSLEKSRLGGDLVVSCYFCLVTTLLIGVHNPALCGSISSMPEQVVFFKPRCTGHLYPVMWKTFIQKRIIFCPGIKGFYLKSPAEYCILTNCMEMRQRSILPYWNNAYKFKCKVHYLLADERRPFKCGFNGSAVWFDCIIKCISELSPWLSFLPGLSRLSVPCATKMCSRKWKLPLGSPWTSTTWTTRYWAVSASVLFAWLLLSPSQNSLPRNLISGLSLIQNRCWIPDPKSNVLILIRQLTHVCGITHKSASCCLVLLLLRTLSFYVKPYFHVIISSGFISILRPFSHQRVRGWQFPVLCKQQMQVGCALEEFALEPAISLTWEENLIKKDSKTVLEWKFVEQLSNQNLVLQSDIFLIFV